MSNEDNIELDDVLIYLNLNDKTETDSLFVQAIQAKDFYVLCKFWPNSIFIRDW